MISNHVFGMTLDHFFQSPVLAWAAILVIAEVIRVASTG